jgi:hypothetical protein
MKGVHMNKLKIGVLASAMTMFAMSSIAATPEQECQKLKDDYNVIYASKGFCFKDPEAKAKFGNENCFTSKPKFSEREQQRLDEIKARQKELNCK